MIDIDKLKKWRAYVKNTVTGCTSKLKQLKDILEPEAATYVPSETGFFIDY